MGRFWQNGRSDRMMNVITEAISGSFGEKKGCPVDHLIAKQRNAKRIHGTSCSELVSTIF